MIYLWRIPEEYPQSLIGNYHREGTPDRFHFKKGEVLSDAIELPVVKFNTPVAKLREFDCLASNVMVPIINSTCSTILREMTPSDIQLIKAQVVGTDGIADDFYILNIVSKIVGINRKLSDFKCIPGTQQIMSFRKLDYLEGCLGTHGLARDSEYLSHLLVSEFVATRLIKERLNGIGLVQPKDVAW